MSTQHHVNNIIYNSKPVVNEYYKPNSNCNGIYTSGSYNSSSSNYSNNSSNGLTQSWTVNSYQSKYS